MQGDFSKMTFDRDKHFLRVLMQQGRVQLDSDWNEQSAILLHYLQTVVADIIGPYAGPKDAWGFEIKDNSNGNFLIGKGRYYVDGILVENEKEVWYAPRDGGGSQPDLPEPTALENGKDYLVYLDVWERHITYIQDDDIREKALNGPDTATRSKVVWQVKVISLDSDATSCLVGASLLDQETALSQACLSARAKRDQAPTEPCSIDPESRYRGAENQLYRVEIHAVDNSQDSSTFTFKWSRDNGSRVFLIKDIHVDTGTSTTSVELEHLGRDSSLSLSVGDWVELVDDNYALQNRTEPLLKVLSIDRLNRQVTLGGPTEVEAVPAKHPFLRRWDHKKVAGVNLKDGAIPFPEDKGWVELEDGIEIQFDMRGEVRRGDYWMIPARKATGDVEWPQQEGAPKSMPPVGVMHHYAPLAVIQVRSSNVNVLSDCRCSFDSLSDPCSYSYYGRLGIGTDLICPDDQS